MENIGWIKLHRSFLDWEWYSDIPAKILLLHLLLSVNYEDKKWKGDIIKAGSMVLSWNTLSEKTCLTIQQARTAMDKLEKCGEVTRKTTNKYQVVSLVKWDRLQQLDIDNNNQNNKQITNNQQTNNKQITTTKEYKNIKNIRNKEYVTYVDRQKNFQKNLIPFLENYSKEMIRNFYDYWTEGDGNKMRFEREKIFEISKRLARWKQNEKEKEKNSAKKEKDKLNNYASYEEEFYRRANWHKQQAEQQQQQQQQQQPKNE